MRELGHFRLAPLRHARNPTQAGRTQLKYPERIQTCQTSPSAFLRTKETGHGRGASQIIEAGFIRDIKHPDWLANLVMVPKKDKSWRLCVDFKDLNKACPKDPFPLPRIDQIIDATAGHDSLCFLDAYSGYHQIKMA